MTAAPDRHACIRLRGARVEYPDGRVGLYATDLDVREGEFLVLLGPSGAGKSTLLRSLNGLVPLSDGTLEAADLGVVSDRRSLRTHRLRTGMVFQQHQLIGRLSVLANVLTGRLGFHSSLRALAPLPRADRLIALDALSRVGLLDRALDRADRLSGGQQQRVGIARAMAQQPRVLLADEPVASLDPRTARDMLGLLRDIRRSTGLSIVVSLHQVDLAREFADRIVGISAGIVVFDGVPSALGAVALHSIYGAPSAVPGRVEAIPLENALKLQGVA